MPLFQTAQDAKPPADGKENRGEAVKEVKEVAETPSRDGKGWNVSPDHIKKVIFNISANIYSI